MRAHLMPYWGNHSRLGLLAGMIMALLSATLLFWPGLIHWLFRIESGIGTDVMSHRAAALFLGLSLLAFQSRNAADTALLRSVDLCLGTIMTVLLVVGVVDYLSGAVGHGIWLAFVVEVFFASGYLRFWRGGEDLA